MLQGDHPPAASGGTVECELVGGQGTYRGRLVHLEQTTRVMVGHYRVTQLDDRWIAFEPETPLGLGMLELRGYHGVPIAWAHGACLSSVELNPLPRAQIVVTVEDGPFDENVWITACGSSRLSRLGRTVNLSVSRMGECRVGASQLVNGITMRSSAEVVSVGPGDEIAVSLEAPRSPRLGPRAPGWRLRDAGDHLLVTGVVPGSPADEAGMGPGDRIVGFEDAKSEGLSLVDLRRRRIRPGGLVLQVSADHGIETRILWPRTVDPPGQ